MLAVVPLNTQCTTRFSSWRISLSRADWRRRAAVVCSGLLNSLLTGRLLSERIGAWVFRAVLHRLLTLTFFPRCTLFSLHGMPLAVHAPGGDRVGRTNLLASVGAVLMVAGVIVWLADVARAAASGHSSRQPVECVDAREGDRVTLRASTS